MKRDEYLQLIQNNINSNGYHVTIVLGGPCPRYVYTIGLTESIGFELILAGGIYFMKDDLYEILKKTVDQIKKNELIENIQISFNSYGNFKLQKVHHSWIHLTIIGVLDYYKKKKIKAYQIVPEKKYSTLDVPNMTKDYQSAYESPWKWLSKKWEFDVPKDTTVVTNLQALKGEPVTEIMRWEEDEWEMFAGPGPENEEKDIRIVPIGLLLSIDDSIKECLNLEIGKGIWRETMESTWKNWG